MAYKWPREQITLANGEIVEAIAPEIISASRATDIPAFYSDWFFESIQRGYCSWINPFNRDVQYISFSNLCAIVFWTKNPEPILSKLPLLDTRGIDYYFLFSLNDYENEKYERSVPSLKKRIQTFQSLSKRIGKERVLWRFDPLLLSERVTMDVLQSRIQLLGSALHTFTDKLIFSFIDIEKYSKVSKNLRLADSSVREFTSSEKIAMAEFLHTQLETWKVRNPNFKIASCAQEMQLAQYGIAHNKCVDDTLLASLFPENKKLMQYLGYESGLFGFHKTGGAGKDPGQREACGCIQSKDIGKYDTCPHGCVYCYANTSIDKASRFYNNSKSLD